MTKPKLTGAPWLQLCLIALLVAAASGLWLGQFMSAQPPAEQYVVIDRPKVRDFSLTDSVGRKVSLATYRGKWLVMFFGFTMCPEACPLAMQKVIATLKEMGESAATVQPIFITIDPERDTPAVLKEYLANFADNIAGLSGTAEETAAIAKLYGVYYQKRPIAGDYTMDHSTALYLVTPDGSYLRPYRADVEPDELAEHISAEMKAWKK
ncbi:MAG: SCO family protein [Rhodospirillaceae bacterium]